MAHELLTYYEQELSFLRDIGAEFAKKHPAVANRLLLEEDKCADPHVERLIQAFAFLAARIHHKIDDEFPEITDSLLGILYPHFLAPLPSMAIIQFVVDETQGKLTTGHRIEKGSTVYLNPGEGVIEGATCLFQTCYPVTLWPVKIVSARLDSPERLGPAEKAAGVIRIELRSLGGMTFKELGIDKLRFFLNGENSLVYRLYELVCNNVRQVQIRSLDQNGGMTLPSTCIRQVGFGQDEGMLPYTPRSFIGYRLLQEFFTFPEKFLFFDLHGIDKTHGQAFGDQIELLFLLNRVPRMAQAIDAETFRLGCTPMVNLFDKIAEPIRVDHTQTEYRVVPDLRRQSTTEVYSIDSVTCTSPHQEDLITIRPAYSIQHATDSEREQVYWFANRRPSLKKGDLGTEVYLSLVNLDFRPALPPADTLTIRTTCTNRDLPSKLPIRAGAGGLSLEGAAPLSLIRFIIKPTETLRSPLKREAQWRLISHLSLNYLSICQGGRGALQEILKLYDFSDSIVAQQQIAGITDLTTRPVVRRPRSMPWNGFCRGIEVNIEFDEDKYVGNSVFLFASVLERFLGLYASVNSFVQLIATIQQREVPLKQWSPRAGEQTLL